MSDAVEFVLRKTPLFASLTDDETQALRRRAGSQLTVQWANAVEVVS
jgi:hypothetical protein